MCLRHEDFVRLAGDLKKTGKEYFRLLGDLNSTNNDYTEEEVSELISELRESLDGLETTLMERFNNENNTERNQNNNGMMTIRELVKDELREMLENGCATEQEIQRMQDADYSNEVFHIGYPLLVRELDDDSRPRYYARTLSIDGVNYYLCSQWFEVEANNDRPYLEAWIRSHRNSNAAHVENRGCRSCGAQCWNNTIYCWDCYRYQNFESR